MGLVVAAGVVWSLQGLIFQQIEELRPWAVLRWRSLEMAPVLMGFLAQRAARP